MIKFEFEEVEYTLPSIKAVCSRCDGEGKIVNPAVDGNGISPEEFREDPDFEEAYFSGVYDIGCPDCNGKNVVNTINYDAKNEGNAHIFEKYEQYLQEKYYEDSMYRGEMGW